MADTPNGRNQANPKEEPSMEKRLLLAFVLMGAVLFLTPYLYKNLAPSAPAPKPAAAPTQTAATQAAKAEAATPAPPVAPTAPAAAAPVTAEKEQLFTIENGVYKLVLSNRGGVVRSWILTKFNDTAGKPLDLVNQASAPKTGYPFSLSFQGKAPDTNVNDVLYAAKPSADGLGIDFEYSNGAVFARKSFRFQKDNYLSQFTSEVTRNGAAIPNFVEWRGGFGDAAVPNAAGSQRAVFYDASAGKLTLKTASDAKNGALKDSGQFSFAGVEDNYFAAVFLPHHDGQVAIQTVSDKVPGAVDSKEQPHVGAAVGGQAENRFSVFVGPKDVDLLRSIDPKLVQLVDFGRWFGWLAKPLFLIVNWLNNNLVHNYGWAIVVVTIIINFAMLPLKFSGMKSMKRMQALQPQIAAINAKYKNVGLRDPRKAEQNAEVMELYKRHGINPMGGCLPMLLQIPFFIAFYSVLQVAIEMRGASWLWVRDLSQPEHLPIHILPILMIIAQFIMQKMTPAPGQDPNQQRMMMLMPLVFGFMFYNMASGLVLYWLTSNVVGIGQQWFINKSMPAPAPQPAEVAAAPKRRKGGRG
jgi:YidC/Oxa1 family membrane protein insertase